ncbi:hypothetical protein LXA43DRAFT_1183752 [Ganoderma leucocontextum]|nr:hypothetical protein LXA43DRAFT_1183752 [Ganoderma leucocontextum]
MCVVGTRKLRTYATICDLPQELLHLILSDLKDSRYWLKHCCSRVCRCLHAACLDLIDFRVVSVYELDSFMHFMAFVEVHPRAARSIVELRLSGHYGHPHPTINAAFVARVMGQLPNLRKLTLGFMRFDGTEATDVDTSTTSSVNANPARLDQLNLNYSTHEQSHLSEIFRVASLSDLGDLDLGSADCFDITSASVPFSLPRPIHVRTLHVAVSLKSEEHPPVVFDALSVHLSPGVLQRLEVHLRSAGAIRGLGRLLSGPACSNVTHLDLNSPPPVSPYGIQFGWRGKNDPLLYEWPSLNIASCARLESIVLHVHAEDPPSDDMPLCSAAAGIISQAPPTLRRPVLKIWGWATPKKLLDAHWLGLPAVDEALSAPSKFPELETLTVQLEIMKRAYLGPGECRAACEAALAGVHAAEKLDVVWTCF